jgi:hypothetical protein
MIDSAARFSGRLALGRRQFGDLWVRLLGAVLQVLSTWAVVRALSPDDAGVYFRGFVITLGLSALLRGKYEIYMARHIIGRRDPSTDVSAGALLAQLARRLLLRSTILCAVLLVITADLDIQAPQLQTVLQTYLPFVLALPGVGIASLIGEALRAANRTLGIVVASFAVNWAILLAVAVAPKDAPLALYSWAFFFGSLLAAAAVGGLAWRIFPTSLTECSRAISRESLKAVDSLEFIGLARGAQLWGPLCILSVWATPLQMAQYAVAARTAMVIDFFLPALNLAAATPVPNARADPAPRTRFVGQLAAALFFSSVLVGPLLLFAPATMALFGYPYQSHLSIYMLLLGIQWINGTGRPAVRLATVAWESRRIGLVVGAGAVAGVIVCSLGVSIYGAAAAAGASLIGAVVLNGTAIVLAFSNGSGK